MIEDRFTLTQETKLFEGAGLVISDNDSMEESERYILVKTPHAKALSALIYRLKEIFRGEIDGFTKYAFYGRLGEAALKSQDDVRTLLLDVIDEAFRFVGSGESIEYFAYGSNMDEIQMIERCPSANVIGVGRLPGYRFALDAKGTATILKSPNDTVWGVIWSIASKDLVILDKYEGIRSRCYKHTFVLIEGENQSYDTLVYISLRGDNHGVRREEYLEKIIQAAEKWQLPEDYRMSLSGLF